MPAPASESVAKPLSPRQLAFARLVAAGGTKIAAYREAYNKHGGKRVNAQVGAMRVWSSKGVRAMVEQLREKSEAKTLLSLNDRLAILSRDAQLPGDDAAMVSARARVIKVYNETAGDHAPERSEVIVRGDPNAPVAVTTVPQTKAQKIAALAARRTSATLAPAVASPA